ncbi:MAG: DUF342 domain-containing protein [Sedimentisphaerales bacterium]|nr:DUF342 domain-containing protein [Sedimentisphaerales bacterium]
MTLRIRVSSGKLSASLDLSSLADGPVEYGAIEKALAEKKVSIGPEQESQIRHWIDAYRTSGPPGDQPPLLTGTPPAHGQDGRFEWSAQCDPKNNQQFLDQQDQSGRASFYGRSSLVLVKKGDILGTLHPPTQGVAGKDVYGAAIEPRPGKDCPLKPGKGAAFLPDGKTLAAEIDGELKYNGRMLWVEPVLSIASDVDFSTGNVDYPGDVFIRGDVKDLFEVHSGADIVVAGTIEAAQVECSGSLCVMRGISGKEKGFIVVDKDLSAKYLSNVRVWVRGDTRIQSEIVNTELHCGGQVILERGALNGGEVTAAGSITAPSLGSLAGVRTIVKAGVDPYLLSQFQQKQQTRTELTALVNRLLPQAKVLLRQGNGRVSNELSRITQEIQEAKNELEAIEREHEELEQKLKQVSDRSIVIRKRIYPGCILYIGQAVEAIDREIEGPVEIRARRDRNGAVTLRFQSLSAVASR